MKRSITVAEAGRRGGNRRRQVLSADERQAIAKLGGQARAAQLTAAARKRSAANAARARWGKKRTKA